MPNIPCFSAGRFFWGIVVVDKSNKAGVFWLFFGEGGIGEVPPEIAMNNEGMLFENRTPKNAEKTHAIQSCDWKNPSWSSQQKQNTEKTHLQRPVPDVCLLSLKLKISIKTRRTWNSKPTKTETIQPKGKLRCTCRQDFVGWTNLSYGKWLGGPLSPCVCKGRRKWTISLSLSSFHHPFGPEMTQNFKKFTCLHFYREILKYDGPDGKCFHHFCLSMTINV